MQELETTLLERALHGQESSPRRTKPLDVFRLGRRWFLAGRRIDMQQLAAELGLHRTTLYRWVGTRDRLLGEIIWAIAEPALREAFASARGTAGERIAAAVECHMQATLDAPAMRRFLSQEPEAALRILTTKEGLVQERSTAFIREVIEQEVGRGALDPPLPVDDLAYLIIRIGESFLYTDLITGAEPAPKKAAQAVRALLR